MENLTESQQRLKEKFMKERGYWAEFWNGLLSLDEKFFEAYLDYSSLPAKKGTLEPKVRELIFMSIDAATTHLYEPGLKLHMQNARKLGATDAEIMEAIELTSVLGIHTATVGIPILVEELANNGIKIDETMTEKKKQLKERFKKERGYWTELWDQFLLIDEEFFESYLNLSSVPWEEGVLEPKIKEFIYIAIDASTTHLYEPGIRIHIKNALKYGATKEEIMEVFQLVSVLGIHASTVGVPYLVDEIKNDSNK